MEIRVATLDDLRELRVVMDASIAELQKGFLSPEQIESSRAIMGLDTQLVEDGTYYVVETQGHIAGCGGWSRRATLYGSDATPGRDAHLLDPTTEPARVRAMYTHPGYAPPRRRPADPGDLRACGRGRGLHPVGADGHDVRRAALHRVRVRPGREARGHQGRCPGPAGPDGAADHDVTGRDPAGQHLAGPGRSRPAMRLPAQ